LPALPAAELDPAGVRMNSLSFDLFSLRAQVRTWDHQAIHADPPMFGLKGSPTRVRRIFNSAFYSLVDENYQNPDK
jgi:hypothetical protein